MMNLLDQLLGAADHAAQRIGMAAEELGGAVQHQVHAQGQRRFD